MQCECKKLHQVFEEELLKLVIKKENIGSLKYALEHTYYELNKENVAEEAALKMQLKEVTKKIDAIEEKYYALNEMSKETFEKFHAKFREERCAIEENLERCTQSIWNLPEFVEQAVDLSSKLAAVWTSSDIRAKEGL